MRAACTHSRLTHTKSAPAQHTIPCTAHKHMHSVLPTTRACCMSLILALNLPCKIFTNLTKSKIYKCSLFFNALSKMRATQPLHPTTGPMIELRAFLHLASNQASNSNHKRLFNDISMHRLHGTHLIPERTLLSYWLTLKVSQ